MRLVAALLLGALGACAPWTAPPGPPVGEPALKRDHIVTRDGRRLPLRVWRPDGPPRAAILALHGFNDYSRAFEQPATYWARRGLVTYAYDQRGFGKAPHRGIWPGIEALTDDLRLAARLVRAQHPGLPLYLVGESMGGAVILAAFADPAGPPEGDGIVLAAPAVWGRELMPAWQRAGLWLLAHTVPVFTVTAQGFNRIPSDNRDMLRRLARDPLVIKHTRIDALWGLTNLMDAALAAAPRLDGRALVLFGAKEDILPGRAFAAFRARLPARGCLRIAVYEKGYHMLLRDLGAELVLRDIVAWIEDPAAPLPSGADGDGQDGGARRRLALKCGAPVAARP